ncbi:urea carboxylase [Prauserella sediminis]|uniref:Urea carboxylase n=1 Tax=Prauserella sediminis TaxID=577680 RepID=A0A839XTW7_9PSEU|nr:biotin-dependent carboxyltransferase family protein [Prauserella sediminis]MBB3664478.1 urea carboxylase [Prauserella sediminis]
MTPGARDYTTQVLEVVDPGLQTTIQDYPGRVGRQALGFFPSGPVDSLAFRVANLLVGNRPGAAALEIPLGRFHASVLAPCTIAVCGAEVAVTLNGTAVPQWESVSVQAGDHLALGLTRDAGYRVYLAIAGGLAAPSVLGSKSTFLVAGIGGHNGRALEPADVLEIEQPDEKKPRHRRLPTSLRPSYADAWEIEVVRGPHADPDFLTTEDYAYFLDSHWRCDLNSDRVAVRFNPHRFDWARDNGYVAGGHPSNMLDGSYPLGGILAYGDVLTILGPDSHTSGGFAVIATVASASFWKVGQLRPGRDTVCFREIDLDQASALGAHLNQILDPRNFQAQ